MRERERAHSTRTNLWCRLTNQKVPESPVENCDIPAEKTFTVNKRRFLDSVVFAFFICSKKCEKKTKTKTKKKNGPMKEKSWVEKHFLYGRKKNFLLDRTKRVGQANLFPAVANENTLHLRSI